MNFRFILLNQVLPVCHISADGNSIFVVVQAKSFSAFLISLCHISHPTYQQIMLALPSKYIQKMTISHPLLATMLVQATIFCLNYCNDLQLVLSALAPGIIFMQPFFSVPCSELSMTSFQSLPSFSSVVSQISCPTTLSHTQSTLDTLALLFLKISIDLSTSGPLCFLFPLPYHPMVSLGLVLTPL